MRRRLGVVVAAEVLPADEDARHGALPREREQRRLHRLAVVALVELDHGVRLLYRVEQLLALCAVRAPGLRVYHHRLRRDHLLNLGHLPGGVGAAARRAAAWENRRRPEPGREPQDGDQKQHFPFAEATSSRARAASVPRMPHLSNYSYCSRK